jgi:hypothetical protein
MSTKRRASTRLAASSTTAVTTETTEDDVDVAALGRAVKRLNTGESLEVARTTERSEYAEVNAMLRALHVERVRRAREREGAGTDDNGT